MKTEPPIITVAKQHGISKFSELINKGLYTVTVPPKQTAEEIRELLRESSNSNKTE